MVCSVVQWCGAVGVLGVHKLSPQLRKPPVFVAAARRAARGCWHRCGIFWPPDLARFIRKQKRRDSGAARGGIVQRSALLQVCERQLRFTRQTATAGKPCAVNTKPKNQKEEMGVVLDSSAYQVGEFLGKLR